MIENLKSGKRRVYQDVLQKFFKAEETTSDEEFERVMKWFRQYEQELNSVLKETKEMMKNVEMLSLSYDGLNKTFNTAFFSIYQVPSPSDPILFPEVIAQSTQLSSDISNFHLSAFNSFLTDKVLNKLSGIIFTTLPGIKRRITCHNGLRKDLESYRRRVRKLQRIGKDDGDKDLSKLIEKLKRTQQNYMLAHSEIITMVLELRNQKQSVLEPCFVSISVARSQILAHFSRASSISGFSMSSKNGNQARIVNENTKVLEESLQKEYSSVVESSKRTSMMSSKENDVAASAKPQGKEFSALKKLGISKLKVPKLMKRTNVKHFGSEKKEVQIDHLTGSSFNQKENGDLYRSSPHSQLTYSDADEVERQRFWSDSTGRRSSTGGQPRFSEPMRSQSEIFKEVQGNFNGQKVQRFSDVGHSHEKSKSFTHGVAIPEYACPDQFQHFVGYNQNMTNSIPGDSLKSNPNARVVEEICSYEESEVSAVVRNVVENVHSFCEDDLDTRQEPSESVFSQASESKENQGFSELC